MATNLALNDELLREAQKIGGFKTKRETVNLITKKPGQDHESSGRYFGLVAGSA